MKFKISGHFTQNRYVNNFTKVISATREELAMDKMYSLVGSNHKVKRTRIKIVSVEEIKE